MLKKLTIGGYLNAVAVLTGLVGLILVVVGHVMSPANGLTNIAAVVILGLLGVAAACVTLFAAIKGGNHNTLSAACGLAGIALYLYIIGTSASQRILMIAGLFSYNSMNMEGWQVFYVCVAAWVLLLVGALLLVISSFMKTVKE